MKKLLACKGFTLIEILVAVLIIGILAAIALPQYQMAVGKARFSELKTLTKSVQDAVQRYYMVNNTYVGANINNLDIDMPKSA
nr:prepilin-type N-terminal cleavage/methylation domain-containing protein [Elusimicrobiaceae bacterium]